MSEKPLSCDRCSMTFTSKAQFALHIRTHSAGQTYECNLCGRTFIRDSYLIRHHNRVHRENRTTANSIATINSVATGGEGSQVFESQNQQQVCDLRWVGAGRSKSYVLTNTVCVLIPLKFLICLGTFLIYR